MLGGGGGGGGGGGINTVTSCMITKVVNTFTAIGDNNMRLQTA